MPQVQYYILDLAMNIYTRIKSNILDKYPRMGKGCIPKKII